MAPFTADIYAHQPQPPEEQTIKALESYWFDDLVLLSQWAPLLKRAEEILELWGEWEGPLYG